jgi:hypothetical protein
VGILEFSGKTGQKRGCDAFCTEAFLDLLYKEKRNIEKYYWDIFSDFCIRTDGQ